MYSAVHTPVQVFFFFLYSWYFKTCRNFFTFFGYLGFGVSAALMNPATQKTKKCEKVGRRRVSYSFACAGVQIGMHAHACSILSLCGHARLRPGAR